MPVASDVASTTDGPLQLSDGNSSGTLLGQAGLMPNGSADKIGFFGGYEGAAVAQPTAVGNTHTVTAGSTTAVYTTTTFDGGEGTSAYTIGDLVLALKNLGLIAP